MADLPRTPPGSREMRAFKIGARARKFALEGCLIEGYDYLYGCIAEARAIDPELALLLDQELEKFERRVQAMDVDTEDASVE